MDSSMAVDRRNVPDEVAAALTVKVGEVSRTSRKHLSIVSFPFLLSEGFDVFCAKANSCCARELQNFRGEAHVRTDPALYMRPGAHSKQAELVPLTHSNFEARVARSYRNYLKRKAVEAFQCEVYVYVQRASDLQPKRRRHRASTVGDHVPLQTEFVQDNRIPGGDVSGAVISTADPGFNQEVGVKRKRAVVQAIQAEEVEIQRQLYQPLRTQPVEGYRSVRMILNGAVVPVQVNVQDLFACITGLQQQPSPASTISEEGIKDSDNGAEVSHATASDEI